MTPADRGRPTPRCAAEPAAARDVLQVGTVGLRTRKVAHRAHRDGHRDRHRRPRRGDGHLVVESGRPRRPSRRARYQPAPDPGRARRSRRAPTAALGDDAVVMVRRITPVLGASGITTVRTRPCGAARTSRHRRRAASACRPPTPTSPPRSARRSPTAGSCPRQTSTRRRSCSEPTRPRPWGSTTSTTTRWSTCPVTGSRSSASCARPRSIRTSTPPRSSASRPPSGCSTPPPHPRASSS